MVHTLTRGERTGVEFAPPGLRYEQRHHIVPLSNPSHGAQQVTSPDYSAEFMYVGRDRRDWRVSAFQFTPRPPSAAAPQWVAAAQAAGILRAGPIGLMLLEPRGWRDLELGDWIVRVEGALGLLAVPDKLFRSLMIKERESA